MITPFDWQEGIGHRHSYVKSRLEAGTPVLMVSIQDGVLAMAMRRQARKIYEVYDRLIFGAVGQQSDVEMLRVASIDFAHQEGFNRSEDDVTIARVVSAMSQPLKRAFGDFNTAPFVVQAVFAEVGDTPEQDQYYLLDFDGDFSVHKDVGFLAPDEEAQARLYEALKGESWTGKSVDDALAKLQEIWLLGLDPSGETKLDDVAANLTVEAALLRRAPGLVRRYEPVGPNASQP